MIQYTPLLTSEEVLQAAFVADSQMPLEDAASSKYLPTDPGLKYARRLCHHFLPFHVQSVDPDQRILT